MPTGFITLGICTISLFVLDGVLTFLHNVKKRG